MSNNESPRELVDPPPKNVVRGKWTNLLKFLILDLLQIIILTSTVISESSSNDPSLIGYNVEFKLQLGFTITVLLIIYFLRTIMGMYGLFQLFKKPGIIELFPNSKNNLLSAEDAIPISFHDITNWVLEIAKQMDIGSISRIYLAKTAIPNAYTIELTPFPFLPRFFRLNRRIVVLNSNILKILNRDEIRAVIAHELAHIKNNDSVIRLILNQAHLFLQIAYLLLYIRMLTGISNALLVDFDAVIASIRILVLFVVVIIATLVSDLAIGFLRKSNQLAELQADIEPLKLIGFKPTINMLIKLGQRTEVLSLLKQESVWLEKRDIYRDEFRRSLIIEILESFPQTEIDEKKTLKLIPRIYLEKQLEILKEFYLLDLSDIPELEERLSQAATQLYEKRSEQLEKISAKKDIIDWRDFDLDRNLSLEVDEISQFVAHLRTNALMLFQNETSDKNSAKNHPSFRTRILFLSEFLIAKL